MAKTSQKALRSLRRRLRYEFDKSMAAGPAVLLGWLVLLALVVVAVAAAALALLHAAPDSGRPMGFGEAMWNALLRMLDGSILASNADWPPRIVVLVATLLGIVIVPALAAVLSTGLAGRLAELRAGRSDVLETDHTVILNWSPAIFDVISALGIANRSRHPARIVVLAGRDKATMEDEIARRVPTPSNPRVICRSGDPTDAVDLGIVSPQTSRSVIVLSPDGGDPDGAVVKSVLALVKGPGRRGGRYRIAAELRSGRMAELARLVGGDEVQPVLVDELLARIMVHSSHQPGLSDVYAALLGFRGSQLCAVAQKPIEGTTFGDALLAYDTSTLIGLTDPAGKVFLNPPMETQVAPGMKAILIAEDRAAIAVTANPLNVDHTAIALYRKQERGPERILMLGWNRRAPLIAFELSRHVAPGSLLTIAADTPELQAEVGGLMISGSNLQVEYGIVDIASRAALESLNLGSYDRIMVLGYTDHMDARTADTRTLTTLLHLRRIAATTGSRFTLVSEMIDTGNRRLAEVAAADDFIVGNSLASLMLAQASRNEDIGGVFADLLDEQGSGIYLRPAEAYLELHHPMSFYTVTEACRRRGEVAIGYVRKPAGKDGEPRNSAGVVLNPRKSETITFEPGDRLVVLARD